MRHLASLILLLFTAGGVVAPTVHRAVHVAEASAERYEHVAAGHHHHQVAGVHGVEWTPRCDRPVELDGLSCVLCKGLSGATPVSAPAAFAHGQESRTDSASVVPGPSRVDETALARGPPHRIA